MAAVEKRGRPAKGHAGDPGLVTDQWRRLARKAMRELGVSQVQLATTCGCSQSVVSRLLNGTGTETSVYVHCISKRLSIEPPRDYRSPARRRWDEIARDLSDDELERIMRAVEVLVGRE